MSVEPRETDVPAFKLSTLHISECNSTRISTIKEISSIPVYQYQDAAGAIHLKLSSDARPSVSNINTLLTAYLSEYGSKPIICAFAFSCNGHYTTRESSLFLFHRNDFDVGNQIKDFHWISTAVQTDPITSYPYTSIDLEINPSSLFLKGIKPELLFTQESSPLTRCDRVFSTRYEPSPLCISIPVFDEANSPCRSTESWVVSSEEVCRDTDHDHCFVDCVALNYLNYYNTWEVLLDFFK
jgi:hypothetical protein